MKISDIRVGRKKRNLVAPEDILAAEARLKTRFPQGYAEYLTTLGEGVLSNLIRVYPPWQVVNDLRAWRRRIRDYWRWDPYERLLDQERAAEFIVFADTINGDEFIFHPNEPDRILVLPHELDLAHDSEEIYVAGRSLWEALDWACTSGVLCSPVSSRNFTPSAASSRTELIAETAKKQKQPRATATPTRSPEEALFAFWEAFAACEEDPQWKAPGVPFAAFREAASAILQQFCTERIYDGWHGHGRQIPSRYNRSRFEETIVDVKLQKSKAFIYTVRPNDSIRKHCWVLLLIDGEWKIDRRKQEGMTFDKYREIAIA